MKFSSVLIVASVVGSCFGWDDADLEVFDVVEEVNQNFYELLGVAENAAPSEIKSAFKKLTLKLHPDKNDSPDADIQFRNLVSVHNVLKDPIKREKYDRVRREGLPNWRSAVYYYRRARKMGLAEGAILVLFIATLSQYAIAWASYFEKKYNAEQVSISRGRGKRGGAALASEEPEVARPSVLDTLPVQLPALLFRAPPAILHAFRYHTEQRREAQRLEAEQREREEREAREAAEAKAARGEARRRRPPPPPPPPRPAAERAPMPEYLAAQESAQSTGAGADLAPVSGGLWTDDDLAELAGLARRHPAGTPQRWHVVAAAMRRPLPEVTYMAAKLKEHPHRTYDAEATPEPALPPAPHKKVKRRAEDSANVGGGAGGGEWRQDQQEALERALAQHRRPAPDRWDKVARLVPGKTKEECMARCKYLSDMLRKRNQEAQEEAAREQDGTLRDPAALEDPAPQDQPAPKLTAAS